MPQPAAAAAQGASKPGVPQPAGAQGQAGQGDGGPGQPQTAGAQAQAGKTQAQPVQGVPAPAPAQPAQAERADAESEADEAREGVPVGAGQGAGSRPAVAAASAGAGAAAAMQTKAAPTQPATAPSPQPGDDAKSAAAGPPSVPTGPGGPATPAGGRPPGAPPPVPATKRVPVRPMLPPRPMPQQTAIIPPPRQPWYRRVLGSPRYLVLALAGILILGGAGAFGISNLSNDSDSGAPAGNSAAPAAQDDGGGGEPKKKRPAVVPANVTVAVLNGTTVPGLAKQVGDRVESHGFQLGTVANTADQEQQRAESVVLFAPGHKNEARAVGKRLGIIQRQPIDPASQELAGDATVVVIAGGDLAQ